MVIYDVTKPPNKLLTSVSTIALVFVKAVFHYVDRFLRAGVARVKIS